MTLPFKITICGLAELRQHRDARVSHVLSILDPEFPAPTAFADYGAHKRLELRFDDIIHEQEMLRAPQPAHVEALLKFGAGLERVTEAHLLVHCHMGISRSTASTALLVAQAAPAMPPDEIFAALHKIRPQIWPNLRIIEMGDEKLGRNGTMVAALRQLYRRQIEADPNWVSEMRAGGRGREINLAYS
ncbi:tyrosine phosphatase family protein [Acidocella sp.]|uniref:tyrosine phosphatase family protein n=1 Tax=Acidocella sp. TaxID=50710 RepID=UPI00261C5E3D|nr:protein-tyrosine-phosphatase [Acidocella sp.]